MKELPQEQAGTAAGGADPPSLNVTGSHAIAVRARDETLRDEKTQWHSHAMQPRAIAQLFTQHTPSSGLLADLGGSFHIGNAVHDELTFLINIYGAQANGKIKLCC